MNSGLISKNLNKKNDLLKDLNKKIEKIYREFEIAYSQKDLLDLNIENNYQIEDKINEIKKFLSNFLRKNQLNNKSKAKKLGEYFSDFEENSNIIIEKYIKSKKENTSKLKFQNQQNLIKEYNNKIGIKKQKIQKTKSKIKSLNKINIILLTILIILIILYPKLK